MRRWARSCRGKLPLVLDLPSDTLHIRSATSVATNNCKLLRCMRGRVHRSCRLPLADRSYVPAGETQKTNPPVWSMESLQRPRPSINHTHAWVFAALRLSRTHCEDRGRKKKRLIILEPCAARAAGVAHNPPLDRQASWHQCPTECQRVDLLLHVKHVTLEIRARRLLVASGIPPQRHLESFVTYTHTHTLTHRLCINQESTKP